MTGPDPLGGEFPGPDSNPMMTGLLRDAVVLAYVEGYFAGGGRGGGGVPGDSQIVDSVLRAARHNRDRFPHLAATAENLGVPMSDPVLRAGLVELLNRPAAVEAPPREEPPLLAKSVGQIVAAMKQTGNSDSDGVGALHMAGLAEFVHVVTDAVNSLHGTDRAPTLTMVDRIPLLQVPEDEPGMFRWSTTANGMPCSVLHAGPLRPQAVCTPWRIVNGMGRATRTRGVELYDKDGTRVAYALHSD